MKLKKTIPIIIAIGLIWPLSLESQENNSQSDMNFNLNVGVYQKMNPNFYKLKPAGFYNKTKVSSTDISEQLINSNLSWSFEAFYEPFKLSLLYKQNYRYDIVNFAYDPMAKNVSIGKANKSFLLDQHILLRKYFKKHYKEFAQKPVFLAELGFSFNNIGSNYYEIEYRVDNSGVPYQTMHKEFYNYRAFDINFGMIYKNLAIKLGAQVVEEEFHQYQLPSPFFSPTFSIKYRFTDFFTRTK